MSQVAVLTLALAVKTGDSAAVVSLGALHVLSLEEDLLLVY